MPNRSAKRDRAYALTTLCPLLPDEGRTESPTMIVRELLNNTKVGEASPMAKVPNTYLCRFAVLSDVFYEGKPAKLELLKSSYLVFVCDLHGDLATYLTGMWEHAKDFIMELWKHCVGFKGVNDAPAFDRYIRRCQVETTFYFNGSNDDPLEDQLKALFLKQELSRFAYEHQGLPNDKLQEAFKKFIDRVRPSDPQPSWAPGLEKEVKS